MVRLREIASSHQLSFGEGRAQNRVKQHKRRRELDARLSGHKQRDLER